MEFRVHTYASLLVMGVLLAYNISRKSDQRVVYAYKLLNNIKHNYNTIKKEASVMVFALHKFRHYLLGNQVVFHVDHNVLIYLANKP